MQFSMRKVIVIERLLDWPYEYRLTLGEVRHFTLRQADLAIQPHKECASAYSSSPSNAIYWVMQF